MRPRQREGLQITKRPSAQTMSYLCEDGRMR